MDICKRHGEAIAFESSFNGCPACDELEKLEINHREEIEKLEAELEKLSI